jgi:hypothetical protein
MTYMQNLEHELHARLESFAAGDLSTKDFIGFVKQTVLDSYHNGQKAGLRPAPERNAIAQTGDQPASPSKPRWENKKRSAANAPSYRGNYRQS